MTRKMTDDEAKRSPLNLRTTREIREKLEQAAADGGRSLTQEAERRLAHSFDASAPTFEDVRLMIREEIRAALSEMWRTPADGSHTMSISDPRLVVMPGWYAER